MQNIKNIQYIVYQKQTPHNIQQIKHKHHPCCNINKYTIPRFGDAQKNRVSSNGEKRNNCHQVTTLQQIYHNVKRIIPYLVRFKKLSLYIHNRQYRFSLSRKLPLLKNIGLYMRNRQERDKQRLLVGQILSLRQNWRKLKKKKIELITKQMLNFPNLLVLEKRLTVWGQRFSIQTTRN